MKQEIVKAYSIDKQTWFVKWATFLKEWKERRGVSSSDELSGSHYFVGEHTRVPTAEAYGINGIMNYFRSSAYYNGFDHDSFPSLDMSDEEELKHMIVTFLEDRNPRKLYRVSNVREKIL
jgi:hypothetical protein